MREVVRHVVTAEGQHGKGVAAQIAHGSRRGGRGLRGHNRTQEDAVVPTARLKDEGDNARPPPAKEYGVNGHTGRVLPFGRDRGVLISGCRET